MRLPHVIALLVSALVLSSAAQAQESASRAWLRQQQEAMVKADRILRSAERLPGLLDRYEMLRKAYQRNNGKAFHIIFSQYLGWYQSFLGDYQQARASYSIAQPAQADDNPSPLTTEYQAQPATDAIAALAHKRRVVFFNEAHNDAMTRSLTVQMLATLRAEGFNTFAAETLYASDTGLNKRGYPTSASGFYTEEPVYGEMVRTALRLGYRVISYEASSAASGDTRETEQARNLYEKAIKGHPDARLVVNAGYAHIVEKGAYLGGQSMAEHFRKISGLDPLTIEQTMMLAHPNEHADHPYYRDIIERLHPKVPIVFMNAQHKTWSLKPGYDVSVIFPDYGTRDGRSTWLTLGGLRKPYTVPTQMCQDTYPCLIEAHYSGESADAVAADRLLVPRSPYAQASTGSGYADGFAKGMKVYGAEFRHATAGRLYLRPGRYELMALGPGNKVLSRRAIKVRGKSSSL